MTYAAQWKALSSRIRGLTQAGELHARYLAVRSSDTYGRSKRLREHSASVLSALEAFRDRFRQILPPAALDSVNGFIDKAGPLISDTNGSPDSREERVWAALVMLAGFETEMSFVLSDTQEVIRSLSERAFVHLQRSIVADPEFRGKWATAFKDGEVACEKLGAVHLLLHGIWAFKVDATGGRTDLVFQEPVKDVSDEERYADGIVLTEWKVAGTRNDGPKQFESARSQAERYAQGVPAGNELTSYRYIVVVTQEQVGVPADLTKDDVVYRHINVAVDPRPPSKIR
jgi:hypothetical protein